MGENCSDCGLSLYHEHHDGYHQLWEWNQEAFRHAREKAMKEFEKRLPKKKEKKWSSLDM